MVSLREHMRQMDQALLVALGVFVGPVQPIIQQLADHINSIPNLEKKECQ